MAQRYFGLDRGETKTDTTEGSSTMSTLDVEIRVDLAAGMSRNEVLIAIEALENYILEANWPPA